MNKQAHNRRFRNLIKKAIEIDKKQNMAARPVSSTLGRFSDIGKLLYQANPDALVGGSADIDSSNIQEIIEMAEEDPELDEVTLQMGASRPIDNLGRIWGNDKINILSKLYGTAAWPFRESAKALTRDSEYDPLSNSISMYQNDPTNALKALAEARASVGSENPGAKAIGHDVVPFYEDIETAGEYTDLIEEYAEKLKEKNKGNLSKEDILKLISVNRGLTGETTHTIAGAIPYAGLPLQIGALGYGHFAEPFSNESVKEDVERSKEKNKKDKLNKKKVRKKEKNASLNMAYLKGFTKTCALAGFSLNQINNLLKSI